MTAEDGPVQELSTARGNTMSVALDLSTGKARITDVETARRAAESVRKSLADGAGGVRIIPRSSA